jgi:hypothetical protein
MNFTAFEAAPIPQSPAAEQGLLFLEPNAGVCIGKTAGGCTTAPNLSSVAYSFRRSAQTMQRHASLPIRRQKLSPQHTRHGLQGKPSPSIGTAQASGSGSGALSDLSAVA